MIMVRIDATLLRRLAIVLLLLAVPASGAIVSGGAGGSVAPLTSNGTDLYLPQGRFLKWTSDGTPTGVFAGDITNQTGTNFTAFRGIGGMVFDINSADRWYMDSSGNFTPNTTSGGAIGGGVPGQGVSSQFMEGMIFNFRLGPAAYRSRWGGTLTNIATSTQVTNTVNETYFDNIGTGGLISGGNVASVGTPQPWGFLNDAGTAFECRLMGLYSTAASTPNLTIRVKLCTVNGCGSGTVTTIATALWAAVTASMTNQLWLLDTQGVVYTSGSAGTIDVQGDGRRYAGSGSTAPSSASNTAPITVNLAANQYLSASAQWSAADPGHIVTLRQMLCKVY
jgi:hypothetical protein